ncbi:MAG: NAD(P)/FAD-dependent oxidoreductase [Moorea sp. SIOASIH]|uniref:lysine-epsilon-oxidase maturase LodB n=1 Tax=Moorena sp. SIOASIH TaxID=2607817 RepID=UPI0013BAECAF|nr:lysine-epsilon-oxidase maturase LodB [Moorena sp. SIOASIH]NEO42032.1 NAD(P)/FAD-dependent oxidoreductase [Moorena sp. SIOASIH]
MSQTPSVDVAIIGGGPAGTALALTICLYSKLTVAVIEQTAYDNLRTGEHVSASLLPLLDYLQVKEPFLADNHTPVYNVAAVWGHSELHTRPSIINQMGEGYLLDRTEFDVMLAEQLVHKGGQLYLETKCAEGEQLEGGGWRLFLKDNSGEYSQLETRYLVDATGRQARISKRLGAKSLPCDSLVGISAVLDFESDRSKTEEVLIESIPEGWWYSAWLPNGTLIVVLMTDIDIMRQGKLQKEKQWVELLSKAIHTKQRVRGGQLVYPLAVKPAQSHVLDRAVGEDWMAIGDAAIAFDPLSSMGVGHAITCGCDAAVALVEYLINNDDRLLKQYQNRLKHNFDNYLSIRHRYYALEQRWLDFPFWKRRTQLCPIPLVTK